VRALLTSIIVTLGLTLVAGVAMAHPGAPVHPVYVSYDDDLDRSWEASWDHRGPHAISRTELQQMVRQGMSYRAIERRLRARMNQRIAHQTRMIHARFGHRYQARARINRMIERQHQRLDGQLAFVSAELSRMTRRRGDRRGRYATPAPVPPRYAAPTRGPRAPAPPPRRQWVY